MTETKTLALHSPQATDPGSVVSLSGQGKVWRKQILPLGSINYQGRQIRFDSEYHKALVRNFREGAFPQVPFQLADATNTHTNDPERTRGELVDLRAEQNGLYGYFKLSDPTVVLNNQNLGVSCRIIENYAREADGRKFGHSLQHVLGTLDPRVTGLKPWESVELAGAQADTTVDLSTTFYTKDGGAMPDSKTEDKQVVELSTAQLERLQEMLSQDDESEDEGDGPDAIFDVNLDPADFADGDEDEDGDKPDEETESGGDDSVALAAVQSLQNQVLELTNKLDSQENEHELKQLAATGLAPAIIEAARPLLAIQSGVVELSNGQQVSPARATRKLLRTVLELSRRGMDVVSFDDERGSLGGNDSADAIRKAQVDEMERTWGK